MLWQPLVTKTNRVQTINLSVEYLLQLMSSGYNMDWVKGNDNMISYTIIVLVSASYSRCYILALFLYFITHLPYVQWTISLWLICIYIV